MTQNNNSQIEIEIEDSHAVSNNEIIEREANKLFSILKKANKTKENFGVEVPVLDNEAVNILGGRWSYLLSESPRARITSFPESRYEEEGAEFELYVMPHFRSEVRNFLVAHELGHLYLHIQKHSQYKAATIQADAANINILFDGKNSIAESEANLFSYYLLLPLESFKKQYEKLMKDYQNNKNAVIDALSVLFSSNKERVSYWLDYNKLD